MTCYRNPSLSLRYHARDPREETRNPIQEYDFLPRGHESCNLQTSVTERSYSWDVSLVRIIFLRLLLLLSVPKPALFELRPFRKWRERVRHTWFSRDCTWKRSARNYLSSWSDSGDGQRQKGFRTKELSKVRTKLLERRLNEAQSRWIVASNMQDSRYSSSLYKMHRCNRF